MNLHEVRIVFMGTPAFAVASLDAILKAGGQVVGVITSPDKPAGRGMKVTESAVKKYAVEHSLHVLQPEKLKNPVFLDELRQLNADIQVIVAFRMLPEAVWKMPALGTINLHGSLLPQYRGAAPINWAIINGEPETGVTTFKLQHAIDTGDILQQEKIAIGENETAGELHDQMQFIGAELLVKTIKGIADGSLQEIPQSAIGTNVLKHAPKIFTEDCNIDFTQSCKKVHNLIRGLSPHPGALTKLNGKVLKVYKSDVELVAPSHAAGEFVTDHKSFLKFACVDGYVHITDLQLDGKKRMLVEDFLRGYRVG